VEDDDNVRHMAHAILRRQGYTIIDAANGAEALQILESHKGKVHLLLTDVIMPEMNGKELHSRAAIINPDLKVLFMSGYVGDVLANRGVLEEDVSYIQKPFSTQGLAAKVREMLDQES